MSAGDGSNEMRRRTFLQSALGVATAGPAAAQDPAAQAGAGRGIKLGYDSWTLNSYGWTAIQYLDYAAGQHLDTVQLSDLPNYQSLEPAYLQQVKEHSQRLGIEIDGGLGCLCPSAGNWRKENGDPVEYARKGLRANKAVGARMMRVYLGGRAERTGAIPLEKHMDNMLAVLKAVRSEALDLGVKIGIETHGDLQALEVRDLIEAAGKDFVGATIDTGNPVTLGEDPLLTLETLAPYALTTHVRDSAVFEHPRGAAVQWVALGDGCIDFAKFFERFRQLCPQCSVQLEILTGNPPQVLPYLEPDYWKAFPKTRAADFARFVALARNGHPFMGTMIMGGRGQRPPEYAAALKEQQRRDLERSFEYAKKVLKLGLRA
jgi:sugar phosphate isomerase/epimerase